MAATFPKNPDGDVSLGNRTGLEVTMKAANSDYPTGGYPLITNAIANNATPPTPGLVNCPLWKLLGVIPLANSSGFVPVFNALTSKLMFRQSAATGNPLGEVAAGTDLSQANIQLLFYGIGE